MRLARLPMALQQLSNTVTEIVGDINEYLHHREELSELDSVAAHFLSLLTTTYTAIAVLCRCHLGSDAAALSRSLLEASINFAYIRIDPKERADLYINYGKIRVHQYLKYAANNQPSELQEEVESLYDSVRYNYSGRAWSGKTLREMADECGWLPIYDTSYRFNSGYVHGLTAGYRDRLIRGKSKIVTRLVYHEPREARTVLYDASLIIALGLQEICRAIGMRLPDSLWRHKQLTDELFSLVKPDGFRSESISSESVH